MITVFFKSSPICDLGTHPNRWPTNASFNDFLNATIIFFLWLPTVLITGHFVNPSTESMIMSLHKNRYHSIHIVLDYPWLILIPTNPNPNPNQTTGIVIVWSPSGWVKITLEHWCCLSLLVRRFVYFHHPESDKSCSYVDSDHWHCRVGLGNLFMHNGKQFANVDAFHHDRKWGIIVPWFMFLKCVYCWSTQTYGLSALLS